MVGGLWFNLVGVAHGSVGLVWWFFEKVGCLLFGLVAAAHPHRA